MHSVSALVCHRFQRTKNFQSVAGCFKLIYKRRCDIGVTQSQTWRKLILFNFRGNLGNLLQLDTSSITGEFGESDESCKSGDYGVPGEFGESCESGKVLTSHWSYFSMEFHLTLRRQHCRLNICWYFGRVWQIHNQKQIQRTIRWWESSIRARLLRRAIDIEHKFPLLWTTVAHLRDKQDHRYSAPGQVMKTAEELMARPFLVEKVSWQMESFPIFPNTSKPLHWYKCFWSTMKFWDSQDRAAIPTSSLAGGRRATESFSQIQIIIFRKICVSDNHISLNMIICICDYLYTIHKAYDDDMPWRQWDLVFHFLLTNFNSRRKTLFPHWKVVEGALQCRSSREKRVQCVMNPPGAKPLHIKHESCKRNMKAKNFVSSPIENFVIPGLKGSSGLVTSRKEVWYSSEWSPFVQLFFYTRKERS